MFERLMLHGAALAEKLARRRRGELAAALDADAPDGVRVSEEEEAIVISGRALGLRVALEPALRWLVAGRAR